MFFRPLIFKNIAAVFVVCFGFAISGCSGGGSKTVDAVFGGNGAVGDSAFTAVPSNVEFGNLGLSTSTTKTIVVKNSSAADIYISSLQLNSPAFSVQSDTCPRAPAPIPTKSVCDVILRFAPVQSGSFGGAISVRYGVAPESATLYVSNFGVSGVGVSPLVFTGIQSIASQTHTSMMLHWPSTTQATSFLIFRMVSGAMVFEKTVINLTGTVSAEVIAGLLPSTSYTWRVRAVDVLGSADGNTVDLSSTTSANRAPALNVITSQSLYQATAWSVNGTDGNSSGDTDIDGDTLNYACFYDLVVDGAVAASSPCSSLVNQDTTSASFSTGTGVLNWTPPYAITAGTSYEFRITATDPFGASSSRVFSATVNSGVPILAHSPAGDFVFPSNFISSAQALTLDFTNSRTGGDVGVDAYTCRFDRAIDGAMVSPTACSSLPGAFSLDALTGILSWTPSTVDWGPYEIEVTATNAAGSNSEKIKVDVRSAITTANMLSYLDASFADGEKFGANSPLLTNWKDLNSAGTTYDGTLASFAGTTASGWNNTAVPTIKFDGANSKVGLGSFLSGLTNFGLDLWVQPSSTTGGVIASNADAIGRGFTLKQSEYETGKVVLVAGQNTFVDEILADLPSGYYRLNESSGLKAYDISGNGRHGTYTSSITYGAVGTIADGDKAVTLDGSTSSIFAPVPIGTTVSIEIWASASSTSNVMQWRTGPNGVGPDLFFSSNISLNTWNGASNGFCSIPATATDGNIHQYVTVINGSNSTATLFYDGAQCGNAGYVNASAAGIYLSSALGAGGYEWPGKFDEIAIYNSALSSARVLAHYSARNRATCRSPMSLNQNQWSNIFASYTDGTRLMNLWVNGADVCSATHTSSLANSSQPLQLGQGLIGSPSWAGSVAELHSYSTASSTPASNNFVIGQNKYGDIIPLTGMRLWLKADSLSYLADNDKVSFWKDQSLVGNTARQTSIADQPVYQTAGINGKPSVTFNGSSCLVTAASDTFTDHTVFAVFKDDGTRQSYERIVDHEYTNGFWLGRDNGTADTWLSGIKNPSPPYGITASLTDSAAHILTSRRAGTNHTLYGDGTLASSETVTAGSTGSAAIGIGCWYNGNGSQRFGGSISEVLVYGSALSAADRARVERYLGSKYTITVP